MRAKYQEWKDYFEKIFYNNDQLLSGVIRDKDNNLHLELNKPNSNLSLQGVSNCEPIGLSAQGFRQVGQITFNLKPYAATSRQKTTLNNNFLYKIDKSQINKRNFIIF